MRLSVRPPLRLGPSCTSLAVLALVGVVQAQAPTRPGQYFNPNQQAAATRAAQMLYNVGKNTGGVLGDVMRFLATGLFWKIQLWQVGLTWQRSA